MLKCPYYPKPCINPIRGQPINRWMNKKDMVYIYIGRQYYLSTRKKEILTFVTNCMNFEGIMLRKIRKVNTVWYYLYRESKKAKLIGNVEMLVKAHKLPIIKWISSSDLMYSTVFIDNIYLKVAKWIDLKYSHQREKC